MNSWDPLEGVRVVKWLGKGDVYTYCGQDQETARPKKGRSARSHKGHLCKRYLQWERFGQTERDGQWDTSSAECQHAYRILKCRNMNMDYFTSKPKVTQGAIFFWEASEGKGWIIKVCVPLTSTYDLWRSATEPQLLLWGTCATVNQQRRTTCHNTLYV